MLSFTELEKRIYRFEHVKHSPEYYLETWDAFEEFMRSDNPQEQKYHLSLSADWLYLICETIKHNPK